MDPAAEEWLTRLHQGAAILYFFVMFSGKVVHHFDLQYQLFQSLMWSINKVELGFPNKAWLTTVYNPFGSREDMTHFRVPFECNRSQGTKFDKRSVKLFAVAIPNRIFQRNRRYTFAFLDNTVKSGFSTHLCFLSVSTIMLATLKKSRFHSCIFYFVL